MNINDKVGCAESLGGSLALAAPYTMKNTRRSRPMLSYAALQQQDWAVNRKRVLRLMRADNLLALRKRRYVLTIDSHHPFAIYPNLVPRLVVNGINQLLVADITYIRLRGTFL